jgi:hypothetical protein
MWLIPLVSGALVGDSMIFVDLSLSIRGGLVYLPLTFSIITGLFFLFYSVYGVAFTSATFLVTTISGDLPFVVLLSASLSPIESNSPSFDCSENIFGAVISAERILMS